MGMAMTRIGFVAPVLTNHVQDGPSVGSGLLLLLLFGDDASSFLGVLAQQQPGPLFLELIGVNHRHVRLSSYMAVAVAVAVVAIAGGTGHGGRPLGVVVAVVSQKGRRQKAMVHVLIVVVAARIRSTLHGTILLEKVVYSIDTHRTVCGSGCGGHLVQHSRPLVVCFGWLVDGVVVAAAIV